jgi:hypothetical protein
MDQHIRGSVPQAGVSRHLCRKSKFWCGRHHTAMLHCKLVPLNECSRRLGAELEASVQWAAQGQRICVWPVVTRPIPVVVIFSSAEVSPTGEFSGVQWHSVTTVTLGAPPGYPAQGPLSGEATHPAGARPSKCRVRRAPRSILQPCTDDLSVVLPKNRKNLESVHSDFGFVQYPRDAGAPYL